MEIPLRLKKILSLVPACDILADVGCDHGMIGVQALKEGKAKKVLFTDISAPSLKKAKVLAESYGLASKCEFILGDGLCERNVDCAVIAGMGGKEILKIINDCKVLPKSLVLNPMRNTDTVRAQLSKNYFFEYDQKIYDKKYYDILSLTKGVDVLDCLQIRYGKTNLEFFCEDFCNYLFEEYKKYVTILNKTQTLEVEQRLQEIKDLLYRSKNAG